MEIIVKGLLLDCDFEEWSFDDKKGTRFYCTLKDESSKKLVQFKIDEKDFSYFKELVGTIVSVNCKIYIKGSYSLKVNGVN